MKKKKRGAGLFKTPTRECPCSYFAHRFFCRCTNISRKLSFISSAFILTCVIFPSNTETGKSLFICHGTGGLLQSSAFKISLFSQCLHHPCCHLFSIGLAAQVCFSVCECVYITVHVWMNKTFLRAGAFSVHVILRVNGSLDAAPLPSKTTGCYAVSHPFFFFLHFFDIPCSSTLDPAHATETDTKNENHQPHRKLHILSSDLLYSNISGN